MTQLSNWHFEECEKEGCTNGAVVGFSNGNIHVCSVCAALPEFSRMKPSVLPRRLTSRLLAVEGQEPVAYMIGGHYLMHAHDPKVDNYASAVPLYAAPQPALLAQKPTICPKCGDTGLADSGGTQPWGEAILVPCDCSLPDPELAQLVHDLNIDGNHRLANVIQGLIDRSEAVPLEQTK